MKKNKFWIIIGVLFLAITVTYSILVSGEREKLKKQEDAKKRSIKDLEGIRDSAKTGRLASDETRKVINLGVEALGQRLKDIDSYLKDSEKDFVYVKGDKNWVFLPESSLQYKSWYNKKRDELFLSLEQNGFVFEKETAGELTPEDKDRIKEKMGFKNWGNDTPTLKEITDAQQQLALFSVVTEALVQVFKDKKNVFPVFQKISFDRWMEGSSTNPNILISKISLKIDCPYAFLNMVINELDKGKIQIKTESMEVSKKANAKDYSEFPNVAATLSLSFQIINEKKVNQ